METPFTSDNRGTRSRADHFVGVATALLLHGVVIAVLLQYAPAREALTQAVPLMVSLITPPAPLAPKPDVLPKPLPVKPVQRAEPRPTSLPPVLATTPEAPAIATTQPTPPLAPTPVDPGPAPVVAPPAPPAPAPPAPVKAAPVTPPNFNADYLNNPAPAYPAIARRQGHQGKVVLRVYVSAAGGADKVEVRSSSGYSTLDQAALNAVRRWRFVPARQGDQPVAAWVLVPLTFTLEG